MAESNSLLTKETESYESFSLKKRTLNLTQAFAESGGFGKSQQLALAFVLSGIMGVAFFSVNLIFFEIVP